MKKLMILVRKFTTLQGSYALLSLCLAAFFIILSLWIFLGTVDRYIFNLVLLSLGEFYAS